MSAITLLSVDRALADRLAAALDGRIAVNMVQALDPRADTGPTVIVLDRTAIPPERSLAAAIATVVSQAGGRPVVLASEGRDADLVLQAIRAGASDVLARAADDAETGETLSRLLNATLVDQNSGGRLTLLLGADPEATAVVATDLAITRAGSGRSQLLIDCTMPNSIAEAYLDLQLGYGIASAVADIERLDASLLSNALARHDRSGVMLLTLDGGTGQEPAAIAPGDITTLVRLLRATFDEVTLCAGSLRHPGLLRDLAAAADRIEIVCAQSIRELGSVRRLVERLAPDGAIVDRSRLLIWDHDPAILLDGRRMTDALGLARSIAIPIDRAALRNALNAGQPLTVEDSGGGYAELIRRVAGLPPAPRPAHVKGFDKLRKLATRRFEVAR
jgi:pilus assembly protein CpaE